jgi:hypothetical protein
MPPETALHSPHGQPDSEAKIFKAIIVDPDEFWSEPLNTLPSFDDKVQWAISPTEPRAGEADLCFRLAKNLDAAGKRTKTDMTCVTVLVDTAVPLGLRDCGAVLACSQSTMHEAIVAAAGALFTVATANHVVSFEWSELAEVLSRDTLIVAAKASSANLDSVAACALRYLGYFQGTSRIEPETTVLGIVLPQVRTLRLSDMSKYGSSLRAVASHRCHQLIGYRLAFGQDEAAFLLATYPIPGLPGGAVRAQPRWPR